MTVNLDALEVYGRADPDGMLSHILGFPQQLTDAWETVADLRLPEDCRNPRAVLLLGMGGSAIGGDLAKDLISTECSMCLLVHRDYHLPAWVDRDTLVIASSYSGNTEETLSGAAAALDRGAPVVGISSGGRLTELLRTAGRPVVTVKYRSQPRAALGHSLIPVLGILRSAGLTADPSASIAAAREKLTQIVERNRPEVPTASNQAKQYAHSLFDRITVVYGAGLLANVARRWKCQINENSKAWAFFEQFPELNHNAVLGYRFPTATDRLHVLLLDSPLIGERIRRCYQVTQRILDRAGIPYTVVAAGAEEPDPLTQMLSTVLLGDFVSYYLALLYGVDPTPIDPIYFLKAELARS